MSNEKTKVTRAKVQWLLDVKFIELIDYLTCLANIVMAKNKIDKWRMCIDFTRLSKACPRMTFHF